MKTEINFKEIAKLIHPDINPNIKDPSVKMTEIIKFRDNPEHLYRLGIEWGIIKDFDINWYKNKIVSFKYNNMVYTGTVFSVEEIVSSWDVENEILHISVELPSYKYLKLKTVSNFIKTNINIVRDATVEELLLATKIKTECLNGEKRSQERVVEKPVNPQPTTENNSFVLQPNRNYRYQSIYGYIRTKGRIFQITRTTAKSVFYFDNNDNKEHYVMFKNVGTVEKRNQ